MFPCNAEVRIQQEAELDGVIKGIRFVVNIRWPVFRIVGDNASSLEQVAGMRASSASYAFFISPSKPHPRFSSNGFQGT